ncbi:hypothetical protein V2J09_004968 [Rumex salicifolius]
MAMKLIHMYSMVTIVVAILGRRAMGQSGCPSTIMGLAPCLGYIQGSSSSPSSSCCTQLASVVQSQPRCLCSLLNGGGSQFGISINQTLALSLPTACNVQTPPISRCNGGYKPAGPTAAPVGSPISSPNTTNNSKTLPSTNGSTSDGNSVIKMSLHLTFFLLFITSVAAANFKI